MGASMRMTYFQNTGRVASLMVFMALSACGDFRGVFEHSVNSTHHATQERSVARSVKNDGKRISLSRAAKITGDDDGERPEARPPIVTKQGTYYFIRTGDTLAQISSRFRVDWESIAQINGLYDSDLIVGRRLFIPNKKTMGDYVVVSKVISQDRSRVARSKTMQFVWPIETPRVTRGFRPRGGHPGLDIGAQTGTPVLAVEDGRVIYADRFTSYGNLIVVKHSSDYFSAYAHNSKILVHKGQRVKRGQKISLVGSTGRSTGPHLHFEVHRKTELIDPMLVLPKL